MSVGLTTFQDNYIRNFPTQVPMKAAQGFIATAAIGLIAGTAANIALLGGAIAATATLIEAVTRPIIRAIFPENPFIGRAIQIITPRIMALALAASLAPWVGATYTITNRLLPLLAWLALNNNFYDSNVAMVEVL